MINGSFRTKISGGKSSSYYQSSLDYLGRGRECQLIVSLIYNLNLAPALGWLADTVSLTKRAGAKQVALFVGNQLIMVQTGFHLQAG